jgi:hypothetical protein
MTVLHAALILGIGSAEYDAADHERNGSFAWIRGIAAGPTNQKLRLEAGTYLIDQQYQLPRGTELRGAGTVPGHRTEIKAVGKPYNACAGTASAPGRIQGRKGLLLGDNTYVAGKACLFLASLLCSQSASQVDAHLGFAYVRIIYDQCLYQACICMVWKPGGSTACTQ